MPACERTRLGENLMPSTTATRAWGSEAMPAASRMGGMPASRSVGHWRLARWYTASSVCVLPPPKAVCSWMTGSPPPARKPLGHALQQQAHALGDEGSGKKLFGVLVFVGRSAGVDLGNVGGKFALLDLAFQHVFVGVGDFAPGFDGHGSTRVTVHGWCGADSLSFKTKHCTL